MSLVVVTQVTKQYVTSGQTATLSKANQTVGGRCVEIRMFTVQHCGACSSAVDLDQRST
jgi:hypothetical protein